MVWFLIIDFTQNICGCHYYIIHLLCGNYTSLHCSIISTRCIRLLCFYKIFKNRVAFSFELLATYTMQGNLMLFPDIPSRTIVVYHDVNVGEAEPVKQPPYPVNPQK